MDYWQVFDDLVRLETMLWNSVDAVLLERCGVSLGAFNAMTVISRTVDCRVQDLADALAITVGGVSQAVDRFEKQGLIVRRPNPANRRSSLLELTGAGRVALTAATQVVDDELADRLAGPLGERATAQLGRSLRTLRAAAEAGSDES
ncbi:MarR family winged helix-turn-helix transcriptional regulator [Jatrophihabitans sp. YIM 134969]